MGGALSAPSVEPDGSLVKERHCVFYTHYIHLVSNKCKYKMIKKWTNFINILYFNDIESGAVRRGDIIYGDEIRWSYSIKNRRIAGR